MKYDVPLYRQKPNSVFCGQVCLFMVAKFFGVDVSFQEILETVRYHKKRGTSTLELAIGAEKLGFETAVWISNYSVFSEEMNEWGLDELRTYFKARWKRSRKVEKRLLYRSLLDYVSLGRKPVFGLIDSPTIKSLLDDGFLVICPVHVPTFRRRSGRDKGHFVLLTGYGADEFFVNDPYPHAKGRISIRHEHLLASLFKLKDSSIMGVKG